ncbi:hypothetical protein Hanom_Chr03g00200261 [Helianthus anomalus]
MVTYANTILGDDDEDETDIDINPIREEFILLLIGESDDGSYHLIHRSSRAGPQQGFTEEPVGEVVPTPVVDPQVGAASQAETRKKKKEEKTGGKKAEELVAETPRPSNSSFLDYVLDAQAAAALAEKKSKFQNESTTAPSESEIDLGVFSKNTGNLLEKIFKSSSAPRASSKSARPEPKIDISKITPPTSPPSKPLDLSPPHADPKGTGKEDDVEVE